MLTLYSIAASGTFEHDFKKLGKSIQKQVDKKIRWAAAHPESLQQPLRHMPKALAGLQKLRTGDYRILFWVDHENRSLTLYAVGHRSVIYRDFR